MNRDTEIKQLEESLARMEDCDKDEIDEDEYKWTLARLVELRAEQDNE